MENELIAAVPRNSIFQQLKDGIVTICACMSELEKRMETCVVDMPEDSALIETVNMASKVNDMKTSAIQMKVGAAKLCEEQTQYCTHMESVVKDMEKSVENIHTVLSKYGYKPPALPNHLKVPQDSISVANECSKLSNGTESTQIKNDNNTSNMNELLDKTPILSTSRALPQLNRPCVKSCLFPQEEEEETIMSEDLNNLGMGEPVEQHESLIATNDDSITLTLDHFGLAKKHVANNIIDRSTPEEPLLRSQKKAREDARSTPEDPPQSCSVVKKEDSVPSTPKTPVLISVRRS